jgi:hypothetical protein
MFRKFRMTFLLSTKVESFQSRWLRSTIFSNGARHQNHFVDKLKRTMPWEMHPNHVLRTFLKLATVRAMSIQLDQLLGSLMIDFQTTFHSVDCCSLPVR